VPDASVEVTLIAEGVRVPGGRAAFEALLRRLGGLLATRIGGSVRLSVVLVDDATIHEVNARVLGHDWPTDVITFPYAAPPALEAELLVSVETARREAAERGHAPLDELALYAVHGALHLVGYDDHTAADRRRMRAAERRWLKRLGRPPVFGG
jgi:probable rRNA maturation factor